MMIIHFICSTMEGISKWMDVEWNFEVRGKKGTSIFNFVPLNSLGCGL